MADINIADFYTALDITPYDIESIPDAIEWQYQKEHFEIMSSLPSDILAVLTLAMETFDATLFDEGRLLNPNVVEPYLYTMALVKACDCKYKEESVSSIPLWEDISEVVTKHPITQKIVLVWNLTPAERLAAFKLEYMEAVSQSGILPFHMKEYITQCEMKAINFIKFETIDQDLNILDIYTPCNEYPLLAYEYVLDKLRDMGESITDINQYHTIMKHLDKEKERIENGED